MLLFAFLIGLQCSTYPSLRLASFALWAHRVRIVMTLSSAIEAGVSTMYVHPRLHLVGRTQLTWRRFVGLGEDPQVLAYRAPALFGLIASIYPRVVQGVPRV